MADKSYPVLSRLDHDGTFYDPEDAATPKSVTMSEELGEPLVTAGLLGPGKTSKADNKA